MCLSMPPSQPEVPLYTFFTNAHGTFSKIEHMTGQKTSLNKFRKTEIISSIFHVSIGHLYALFREVSIQVLWSF